MHSVSMMISDKAVEVTEELFLSFLSRYQIGLETLMKGSCFILDCLHFLCNKCHKTNFKPGESYEDSHDWIKTTINPTNKKDNAFNRL